MTRFYARVQTSGESVSEYAIALEALLRRIEGNRAAMIFLVTRRSSWRVYRMTIAAEASANATPQHKL